MRLLRRRMVLLPIVAAVAGSTLVSPAAAQETPAQEVASLELRLEVPNNADLPPQIIATVRDSDGSLVPGVVVDFVRELEFLGTTRMAVLGSATTDVSGTARLVVIPRQEGAVVAASVRGSDVGATLDVTFPAERVDTFFEPGHEHGLLTPLRKVMPPIIAGVVALLWLFVIGLVVRTFRRIKQLAEREEARVA